MLNVEGFNIEIHRGDAAGFVLSFTGDDKPTDGTVVIFQIRPAFNYDCSVVEKVVTVSEDEAEVTFSSEDTKTLWPGTYYWNACIQYADGQEPWTVLQDWAEFRILPGITYDPE